MLLFAHLEKNREIFIGERRISAISRAQLHSTHAIPALHAA
jgi:hypothetical protein